jgi:hypothetical protein
MSVRGSLIIAIVAGVAVAGQPTHWSPVVAAAIALSVLLVALTFAGMAQARRMTIYRQHAIEASHDGHAMTVVTLAILVPGAQSINVGGGASRPVGEGEITNV